MKILLLEDSPTQAALTKQDISLISPDINIEHAKTVREARGAILLRRYDLIILDITLPDGSGLDVCRSLKANELTRNVPVVLFSAEQLSDLRQASYQAGADFCVTKGDTAGMTLNLIITTVFRRRARANAKVA